MDFKKLAMFIRILGLVVLAYGAVQWIANQPETYKEPAAVDGGYGKGQMGSFLNSMDAQLRANDAAARCRAANAHHAEVRGTAVKIMIAGGIVLFLGFAIASSAKKTPSV